MLTYDLSERGGKSLYEYLYECIRSDIESGALEPGEKLPSKRVLAKHLGVSLITVEGAYAQLIAEGYVSSRQRCGYFAQDLGLRGPSSDRPSPELACEQDLPDGEGFGFEAPELEENGSSKAIYDFTGSRPVPGVFPYSLWAKTMRQVLSSENEDSLLDASRAQGSFELRSAIADYLQGFRGMAVSPEQVVVGAGAQVLYQLIIQLLGRDVPYAVEDPGYPRLTSIYAANDVGVRHIPLDGSGVCVASLRESGAQVLHCMPSHQYPTGSVMSASRRREVLEWAAERSGRYIIEDDYDCEFRLAGRPIPSLQSIDRTGCVIYANTFTRSMGPAFRFGYVVLPKHLAARFRSKLGFYTNTVSALDQLALARFIRSGSYERHVNRLKGYYRKVQAELVEAIRRHPGMSAASLDSGLHFVLEVGIEGSGLSAGEFESAAEEKAAECGIAIRSLSSYRQDADAGRDGGTACFVVGLAGLRIEDAASAVDALADLFSSLQAGGSCASEDIACEQ